MNKFIIGIILFFLFINPASATDWPQDANCMGAFLMEGETTETDKAKGNTLSVSTDDTIPRSEDKKFGSYSRDFELDNACNLYHNDGLDTDISGATAQVSLCIWWKPESLTSSTKYIMGKYTTDSNNRQYALRGTLSTDGDSPAFVVSSNGTSANALAVTTTANLSVGTWYHIAGVSDNTNIYIYIDGVSTSTSWSSGIYNGNQPFKIGSQGSAGNIDGLLDDAAVFNTALDSTDIDDIMTNGLVQAETGATYSGRGIGRGISRGVFR